MWGQGLFTPYLPGLVSLACHENYELPALFATLATSPLEEVWSLERHTGGEASEGVNLAAYKTPDFTLASAQDYRAGKPGLDEHVWQATLGPEAIVFVNHPGCSGEKPSNRPGYWCGNGVLPRLGQWKDALVGIYRLPEDAIIPYTHAYFPTFAFDEYHIQGNWAFARKGNAFLALTAAKGIELTRQGPFALRELRSPGGRNAWYCQMGRAARDGDFASFQKKVVALEIDLEGERVRARTLGGDALAFGWRGDFQVNGVTQALSGFRHYESPYASVELPCTTMEIQVGEDLMRLDLQ
jgi:hypothetical protein